MKFNQIETGINSANEIIIKQIKGGEYQLIRITKDQADIVADEIKKLAKELKQEKEDEINEK